jgi:hypothetical protein
MYTMQENTLIIEACFRPGRIVNARIHSFDYVHQIVARFRTTGSVMKGKSTGTPQTDQNVDQVEELVAENHHSSTRRMSAQTNVSHTNERFKRIRSRCSHMHPYKVSVVQEILPRDHNNCMYALKWWPLSTLAVTGFVGFLFNFNLNFAFI